MKFLEDGEALGAIKAMLGDSAEARLAVAFWGKSAIDRLGLDRKNLDLRIVCNLDSGACNPDEISDIIKLCAKDRVVSDPRLHAKVYWTPGRVIMGSSNASANGLAVEGDELAGWAEANVMIEDAATIKQIGTWFDRRFETGYVIEPHHLERAKAVWAERRKASGTGTRMTNDLLAAYRASPDRKVWNRVRLALWTENIDEKGEAEAKSQVKLQPVLADYDYYQDWQDKLRAADWLVDIDLSGKAPALTGYWYLGDPKIESATLTYVRKHSRMLLPAMPPLALAPVDIKRLEDLARALLEKFGKGAPNALVPIGKVVEMLDAAAGATLPDPAAFNQAMRSIYDQAAALGYRPLRFLEMLQKLGGVATARELLRPGPPSEGLTKLFAMGKPELSVEALALDPQWQPLFTSAEIKEARRKLGR